MESYSVSSNTEELTVRLNGRFGVFGMYKLSICTYQRLEPSLSFRKWLLHKSKPAFLKNDLDFKCQSLKETLALFRVKKYKKI